MGRYAYFSTGFQYKFAIGVQPSSDILAFGGSDKVRIDIDHIRDEDEKSQEMITFLSLHDGEDEVLLSRDEADELPWDVSIHRSYVTEWTDINDIEFGFILALDGTGLPVPDWSVTQDIKEFFYYIYDLYNINNDRSPMKFKLLLGALIVYQLKRDGGVLTAWWNYE